MSAEIDSADGKTDSSPSEKKHLSYAQWQGFVARDKGVGSRRRSLAGCWFFRSQ